MGSPLAVVLTLISGACWTLVYLSLIYRGLKDKTCGMPLFALAFNLSWEFTYAFLIAGKFDVQRVVNVIWFTLDAAIAYTYFRYGRKEFPKTVHPRWFVPWSLAAFAVGFVTIYYTALEFEHPWGAAYSAFAQNLMMSVLFVGMLVRRNNVEGQSMGIAVLKWLGTVAPTVQVYVLTGDGLLLALGLSIFLYDVVYIVLLYHKFREVGLNPWTRGPVPRSA